MVRDEVEILDKACADIRRAKVLQSHQKERLLNVFGKRFENALKAVEEGIVKKYVFEPSRTVVWIVVGKERDYQVIPVANYCSCDDFYYRVVNGEAALCYHIIAQKLAEALNRFEIISDSDDLFDVLMREWRLIKKKKIGKL
jgi:predicted nucleic acid-binding Zn finger protein